jgi:hypothetical protein
MNLRLGKHPKKHDARTLLFSRYLPKLPTPPVAIDHASLLPANIGMMGNDVYGDCAVAAPGHMVQSWSVYAQNPIQTIPDTQILAAYNVLSPNDTGCYMLDVLNYWKKTGIGPDKLEAFIETSTADLTQAKLAIDYFGSLYIGMSLPDTNTFGPWDVPSPTWKANPYNGHAVCLIAYDDARQMFKVATWGEVWDMSYGWFSKYCDESYACLNDIELIKATGKSPEGFDWAALTDDLNHIGDPVTPPTPAPSTQKPFITTVSGGNYHVFVNGVMNTNGHVYPWEAQQEAETLLAGDPTLVVTYKFVGVVSVALK